MAETAEQVVEQLRLLPESVPLGESVEPERLQAAMVLPAGGDYSKFQAQIELAQVDWRDALVSAGLASGDWNEQLAGALGR